MEYRVKRGTAPRILYLVLNRKWVVNLTPGAPSLRFYAGPWLVIDTLAKRKFAALLGRWTSMFRLFRRWLITMLTELSGFIQQLCTFRCHLFKLPLSIDLITQYLPSSMFYLPFCNAAILSQCIWVFIATHHDFCFEKRNVHSLYGLRLTCTINIYKPTDKE
jgi:hypothetical protein